MLFSTSKARYGAQQADSHSSVSTQGEMYSSTHLFLAEGIIIEMFLSYTIHKNRGVSFGLTN